MFRLILTELMSLLDAIRIFRIDLSKEVIAVKTELENIKAQIAELKKQLQEISQALNPPPAERFLFFVELEGGNQMEITQMQMRVDETKKFMIQPVDKFGNPAAIDGKPEWSLSDPAKGTLVASEDGLSVDFTPAGAVGDFELQVNGDADLGEGVKIIAGSIPVSLLPGEAVAIEIIAV